jgi:Fe2+ transport system protein B
MHIENIEKIFREDIPEKEKTNKDLERFHLEVKKTLAELEENRLESSLRQSILEKISQWKKQNMTDDVISGGIFKKITWSIYSFIQDILTEPPEISTRKEKINLLEKQLFSYYKLFIKEKSPEMRDEMKENIKNLRKEKGALKEEVSEIQKKYKEDEYIKNEESVSQRTVHELISLLGWILFFYLMYFFASLYASPLKESPSIKQFLEPTANNKFVVLLTIMFIVYAAAKGKRQFFPGKKIATIATWILTSMLSIFIILNFS